jgi:RNA polymerase sigma-70 factor (ECF subfamily)
MANVDPSAASGPISPEPPSGGGSALGRAPGDDLINDWLATGTPEAFNRLMETSRPWLAVVVRRHLREGMGARLDDQDMVQEALLRIIRRAPHFREHRPVPFRLFAMKIAQDVCVEAVRNHILAEKRSVALERPLEGPASGAASPLADLLAASITSPSSRAARAEVAELVREALLRLSPKDREVLELRQILDLPFEEIAAALGRQVQATKMRYYRAIERLGDELHGLNGAAP